MWKTFFASPIAGALAAALGWIGAILFQDSMTEAEFASLRFGWTGAMVGGIAIAGIIILFLVRDLVEPIVMAAGAVVAAFFLWDRTELPISTANFGQTGSNYWFIVTMMVVIFLVLLMGLRAARETNTRAR